MSKQKAIPAWGIKVKQVLIERQMSIKELAEAVGYGRTWVSQVINGTMQSEQLKDIICKYLEI
jgi:DNA-binding Xre family transcriptional regulator